MGTGEATIQAETQQQDRQRSSTKHYRLAGIGLVFGLLFASGVRISHQLTAQSVTQSASRTSIVDDLLATTHGVTESLPSSAVLPFVLKDPAVGNAKPLGPSASCLATPNEPTWQTFTGWSEQLNRSSQAQVSRWQSALIAHLEPEKWPEIHDRARLAKVPVIMYHDVLPEAEVFFDITIEALEADFRLIQAQDLTPISLDQLVSHLRTGVPLPSKPVVLTFDDGYIGHYDYVFQLLKRYRYPAAFSIFTDKVDGEIVGRSTLTWEQLQEMASHPLVTIASHSVTHPSDLRLLADEDLTQELEASKQRLEDKLNIPIRYFTYPEGNHDQRVVEFAAAAGYTAALIMDNVSGQFAGSSENLFMIERFGESRFEEVIEATWGGPPLPGVEPTLDFESPIQQVQLEIDDIPLTLISGGHPQTIHADSRYPLVEIVANSGAVAAVDGAFFSLEYLDSNTMIGPVLSQNTGKFVPGDLGDINKLKGRPLVLVGPQTVQFVPFNPTQHNQLSGIQQLMPAVTDAFVGAAWLVHEQKAQTADAFKDLYAFDSLRHRAFWGINQSGQPVVGATHARVDSVFLSQLLEQAGFQEAIMLDSGQSTSLVYQGESLMGFESRPVPHVVALTPPSNCLAVQ